MDKRRRERLKDALRSIEMIVSILQGVCDKEESCAENYPENLQNSDKYEKMESAIEHLNDAIDKLDEVKELISAAIV